MIAATTEATGHRQQIESIKAELNKAGLQPSVDQDIDFLQMVGKAEEGGPKLRLDLVEFELRHTKEHVDKLKFNFLEMATKQQFMHRLLDSDEWGHLYNNVIWTPGDMKALEKQMEPTKASLVEAKGRTGELESQLARVTEHLCGLNEMVGQKLVTAGELEGEIGVLEGEVNKLKPDTNSTAPMRSLEELHTILDDQIVQMERKRAMLEERRAVLNRLASQATNHQAEVSGLVQVDSDLQAKVAAKEARERDQNQAQYTKQLSGLAEWYRAVLQLHTSLTGVQRIELVRPDYLLVTLSHGSILLPVHLKVCPATGKLLSAQIGSTSNTPKRLWKELVDTAVDTNNIPYLIRQVHAALCK